MLKRQSIGLRMKSKLFFLYYGDVTEGIFDSQVHYHLEMIAQRKIDCTLLVLLPVKLLFRRCIPSIRKLRKVHQHGIKIILLPILNPLRPYGLALSLFYAYMFSLVIRVYNSIPINIILHTRGMYCGHFAQNIKRFGGVFRSIFDMRAEEVSELLFRLEGYKINYGLARRMTKATREMQGIALRRANVWLMVSHKLRSYVNEDLGLRNPHTFVIPSLARSDIFRYDPTRRDFMRRRLGLNDKLVLGYSGSVSPWQKVDKVLDILNDIRSRGFDAVLLLLTRDTEKASCLVEKKGCIVSTRIMSCDYRKLGDHIMCFDVGFLLRERLILNQVASPTKFAEYMLCGVPAFVSAGIGDLDDILRFRKVGVLVQNLSDNAEIALAVDRFLHTRFDPEAISRFGRESFARESYLSVYEKLYSGDCVPGTGAEETFGNVPMWH
jgi:glycosyltransferase involved in cell wall biosynthesis